MPTAVITGASRGIGLEFCRQLKEKGWGAIPICRKASPELKNLQIPFLENVDVTDDKSVASLTKRMTVKTIDLLINNAGIWRTENLDSLNFDTIREQFETNTLGALRVIHALLPFLRNGSKIALITSRMGSIADNSSGGRYGYRISKAALNAAGKSLAVDLKPEGIAVAILHPGYVKTAMTDFHGTVEPKDAVASLLQRIESLNLENSGTFWHANGEVLPW